VAATPSHRVLVVEDEAVIRDLVTLHLELAGHTPVPVGDGKTGLERARSEPFDLVILDLMLPGLDGITVCRAIRRDSGPNRDVPILMLTARGDESDKVLGLESGADDYLTKPFGVRELVARVAALLRRPRGARGSAAPSDAPIAIGDLEIDPARRRVRVRGADVELTRQEFNALHLLASHPGIVFSRESLLKKIWPEETYVTTRSVDTLVKRVRHKIEADPADPRFIQTVWGTGYKFADTL
jgi:two-component system, OmpR family, alkaline phosphatase synthesis response regulator PhoP